MYIAGFYILIFIFGSVIGSFLNVLVNRYNTGASIITGRSKCFSCNKTLAWYELVPIVSFLIQRGKCRACQSKISWQYPIIETITGVLFVLIFSTSGGFNNITFFSLLSTFHFLIIFSLLIAIAVYDFKHQIIPNGLVYGFIILSFISLFFSSILHSLLSALLTGIGFFLFFALLWLISRGKAMGFGDAKLALGVGWLLGLQGGILALLLSFWIGALVGIFLIFSSSFGLKSKIPFGPFLVLGAIISFLFGDIIIGVYLGLI